MRLAQGVDSAEQRIYACDQMREAQVLRQEIIGAEPQARNRIQLGVACRQKDDGQLG